MGSGKVVSHMVLITAATRSLSRDCYLILHFCLGKASAGDIQRKTSILGLGVSPIFG